MLVSVERAGRVAPGYEEAVSKEILFNIAIERLVLGILPHSAQWMVLWGMGCITFAVVVMVPSFYALLKSEEAYKES